MFKRSILFIVLLVFAILNTLLLSLLLVGVQVPGTPPNYANSSEPFQIPPPPPQDVPLVALQTHSLALVPISWAAVVGAWIWRGRAKSDWTHGGWTRVSSASCCR